MQWPPLPIYTSEEGRSQFNELPEGGITPEMISGLIASTKLAYVAVEKLRAGNLKVGQYIRSTSYVAGSAGWTIEADGDAEFNNVTIRGYLAANSIIGMLEATTGGGFCSGDYSSSGPWVAMVGGTDAARLQFSTGITEAGYTLGFIYGDYALTVPYMHMKGPTTTALPAEPHLYIYPGVSRGIWAFQGDVYPYTDSTFSLGSSLNEWAGLYVDRIYDGATCRWELAGDLDLAAGAEITGMTAITSQSSLAITAVNTFSLAYTGYSSLLLGTTGASLRVWASSAWKDRVIAGANVSILDADGTTTRLLVVNDGSITLYDSNGTARLVITDAGAINLKDASGNTTLQIASVAPTINADCGDASHTLVEISPGNTIMARGTYSWTTGGDTLAGSGTMTTSTNSQTDVALEYAAQPVVVDMTVSMRVSSVTGGEWWAIRPGIEGAYYGNSALQDTPSTALSYYYMTQRVVQAVTPVGLYVTLECGACAQTTAGTIDQVQIAYVIYRQ